MIPTRGALAHDRRAAQPAGDAHRRRDHGAAGRRHPGVGKRQQLSSSSSRSRSSSSSSSSGIGYVSTANWVTAGNRTGAFIPPNIGLGEYGWSGDLRGAGVVFFAYIGFDAVSTTAQEAKQPAARHADRHPRLAGRSARCSMSRSALVMTGIVSYDQLNVPDPVAVGIDAIGIGWLSPLIKLGDHPRADLGDPGHAAGPAADFLRDGTRRSAAAVAGDDSSALPYALGHDNRHRRCRR